MSRFQEYDHPPHHFRCRKLPVRVSSSAKR
jgi:hypothetical protein